VEEISLTNFKRSFIESLCLDLNYVSCDDSIATSTTNSLIIKTFIKLLLQLTIKAARVPRVCEVLRSNLKAKNYLVGFAGFFRLQFSHKPCRQTWKVVSHLYLCFCFPPRKCRSVGTTDHCSISGRTQHPFGVHHNMTRVRSRLLWVGVERDGWHGVGGGTALYRSAQAVGEGRVQCGDAIITDESSHGLLWGKTLPTWLSNPRT